MPYKIGIIGAARRHQGTGPFIARNFANLGHDISAFVGTSRQSIQETSSHLSQQFGIHVEGYLSFEELIEQHRLDILVISSPPDTHLEYLEKALENKLHVFCEKPFWWPESSISAFDLNQYETIIQNIINLAQQNKKVIHLNTQWPYTLCDFMRLYPSALAQGEVNTFEMSLSPQSQGRKMLVDAASHGLSMLYQLVGTGKLDNIEFEYSGDSQSNLTINFEYIHSQGCTKTTLDFTQSQEIPKPASYQINGFKVNRTVSLPEYQIQLQSEQCTVNIQDPLDASIEDFLASVDAGLESDNKALLLGARHLYQLIENY